MVAAKIATILDFITAKPRSGCGWPPEKVEKLIKDDAKTLALWREAVTAPEGARTDLLPHNNIMQSPVQGTSKAYTLDRLKRETPALFERVCAGELSANAAAIEAGFRKKPTPFEQAKRLIPKLSKSEKRKLIELLEKG